MKTTTLSLDGLTLPRLLKEAGRVDVVFISTEGEIQYALVPASDLDQEILALRSNAEFLTYWTEALKRAKSGPRKSLAEIRAKYGLDKKPAKKPRRRKQVA
jgi:hypothetical protein